MLKRFRPAPHGRAHRIRKRTNHVTLIVENRIPLEKDYTQTDSRQQKMQTYAEVEEVVEEAND